MNDDPIVAQVRKVRDELAAALGYDVHAIFAGLRQREVEVGDRLVGRPSSEAVHPTSGSGDLPSRTAG